MRRVISHSVVSRSIQRSVPFQIERWITPPQTVGKIDAASRQLNAAILLWFSEGDPVPIHTLACSAHQIVHDINRQRGGLDLIYDNLNFKDEYRRQVIKHLKQHYNFFKHADTDADASIEFDSKITEWFILYTSLGLEFLGCRPDEIRGAFNIYYALLNPQFLSKKGRVNWIESISQEARTFALRMRKYQFFAWYTRLRRAAASGSS